MNWKKRVTSLVLAVCLLAGMLPTMAFATETPRAEKKTSVAGMPFTDVEAGSWYSDAVQYVYDNKLMNGTAPTKFEPYTVMSRAMVVRILYNKSGNPEVTGDSSGFTDVNKSDWYFTAVKWAYENGYASGVGNNRFDPNADVTREQFAQFLYNYAGKQTVEGDYLSKFPDGDSVSWSKNSMNWAVSHKLINGTKENDVNYLRPQNGTTRAQAAIILRSFCLMQEGESNYAILDLNVSGQKATVQASASGACTLNIRFLNEDTDKELNISATASVPAGTEMGEVTADITGNMLPTHYKAVLTLTDANGKQLCDSFTSMKYTTAQEKFDAQTVDDFKDETVINFDEDKTDNFGVLDDTVKTPTAQQDVNVIEQDAKNTYTVTNADASAKSLKKGDEALFYDENGEEVLVSVENISVSGSTVTITPNEDAVLSDFYQVLKVDETVAANPADIDMSDADEGVTLVNENAKQSADASGSKADSKGEELDLSKAVKVQLEYKTKHFKVNGSASIEESIELAITYDAKLFGEDYVYCKVISTTTGKVNVDVRAKVDNDEAVKNQTDKAEVKIGRIPFPIGAGFSVSVAVTLPMEISLEGGVSSTATSQVKAGFIYDSDSGRQNISSKSFNVDYIRGEAKFEVKIGPKIALSVEFLQDVIKAELSVQAGGDFTATVKIGSAGTTNSESIHACTSCLDGEIYLFVESHANLKWKITKHVSGTIFDITLMEMQKPITDFYVSLVNDKDSPLGGKIKMGFGTCPNNKYRTTFRVKDTSGTEVKTASVAVAKDGASVGTAKNGENLYLYNGDYTASSKVDNKKLGKSFEVKNAASTVTLNAKTDGAVDPNKPKPGDTVANGKCGDDLTWKLDSNGTLFIEGTGKMYNYRENDAGDPPWYDLDVNAVYIGDGVTNIGRSAFYGCSMKTLRIPDTVTRIADSAFWSCSSLKNIDIPEGVVSIGEHSFGSCDSAERVTIPSTLKDIEPDAFTDCYGVKAYQVAAGNPNYCAAGGALFDKAMTKLIRYPNADEATEYAVPNGVVEIENGALWYSKHLVRLSIPSSVQSMGSVAGCDLLEEISVDPNNAAYCSVDGILFTKGQTKLIWYSRHRSDTSYDIPSSVEEIGPQAFGHCENLKTVNIPNGVKTISTQAFYACTGLTSIAIPDSVTSLGFWAFEDCSGLETATIGSGVTKLDSTFYKCSSLKTVTIADSVTEITSYTFHATNLDDVYFKGSKEQWDAITIDYDGQPCLKTATIHYNS